MKERQRSRKRFMTAKNVGIGSGVIAVLAKVIYGDLKNENGFIRSVIKKIKGPLGPTNDEKNIVDITERVKIDGAVDKSIK